MHSDTIQDSDNEQTKIHRMRIGEFARITGVTRETIHYYLREGLLPPPEKINARVSYFDAGHLARIKLIKQFKKIHYPLTIIKKLLEDLESRTAEEIRERILPAYSEFLGFDGDESVFSVDELSEQTGLSHAQLARLQELGVLQPDTLDETLHYTQAEKDTAQAVKILLEQGVDLEALSFVRRYSEMIEQEHGFIYHHLLRPADAAGRSDQVDGILGFRALRTIEAYLLRQFRRLYAKHPGNYPVLPDPLMDQGWTEETDNR